MYALCISLAQPFAELKTSSVLAVVSCSSLRSAFPKPHLPMGVYVNEAAASSKPNTRTHPHHNYRLKIF